MIRQANHSPAVRTPPGHCKAHSLGSALMRAAVAAGVVLMAACSSTPGQQPVTGKLVCDSYLVMDMCVRDLAGDGRVDMIYFTDTQEIFMYREGMRDTVSDVMPLHRCAVSLSEEMQATTNEILNRENLSLTQELAITRRLISNYVAAKPEIDSCNARFDAEEGIVAGPAEEFYVEGDDWSDDPL